MKQMILILATFFLITSSVIASDSVRFIHKIIIQTKQGNHFKGILMKVTDSSVFAFPGKWGELKRRKTYKTIQFSYERIEEVQLKRKGRIRNGMAAGAVAGGLLAQKMNSATKNNQNLSYATAISITGGSIAGAVVASKLNNRIFINGKIDLFQHFVKIVRPYLQ